METLPDEIIEHILRHCSAEDMLSVACCSRRLARVANNETLWNHAYLRDFGFCEASPPNWKAAYRDNVELNLFEAIMQQLKSESDETILKAADRIINWPYKRLPHAYIKGPVYSALLKHFRRFSGNADARSRISAALFRIADSMQVANDESERLLMRGTLKTQVERQKALWRPLINSTNMDVSHLAPIFIVITGLCGWILAETCSTSQLALVLITLLALSYPLVDETLFSGITIAAAGCFGYHSIVHFEMETYWMYVQLLFGFLPSIMLWPEGNVSYLSIGTGFLLRYPISNWLYALANPGQNCWLRNAGKLSEVLGVCCLTSLIRPTQVLGQWRLLLFLVYSIMRRQPAKHLFKRVVARIISWLPGVSYRLYLQLLSFYLSTTSSDVFDGPHPGDVSIWPLPIIASILRVSFRGVC